MITVIEAKTKAGFLDIKKLLKHKDLLYFFVLRDITVLYKQSVLGIIWAIINPLFSSLVFTVIFGQLAAIPSDGVPYILFSYCATMPWSYFAAATNASTNSLITARTIFTKVYFPRIIFPVTPVLSKLLDFFISFSILVILLIHYQVPIHTGLLMLPVLILVMIFCAASIGIWVSCLALQYRDIRFAMTLIMQLLMYAAPVVFPAKLILERFGEKAYILYGFYPMTGVIEGFRSAIIGHAPMPWALVAASAASSVVLLLTGIRYFNRVEYKFADVS